MLSLQTLTLLVVIFAVTTFVPFREAHPIQDVNDLTARDSHSEALNIPRGDGDDFFSDIVSGIASMFGKDIQGWLDKVFGAQPPTCCDGDVYPYPCRFNVGKTKDGHGFQACYRKGDEEIIDADVDVMKCIINLHYLEAVKCITITNDACGAGYGGGLMKGEIAGIGVKGHAQSNLISDQDSKTLQAAVESMRGVKIQYDKHDNAPIKFVTISADGQSLDFEIDFAGHQGREC